MHCSLAVIPHVGQTAALHISPNRAAPPPRRPSSPALLSGLYCALGWPYYSLGFLAGPLTGGSRRCVVSPTEGDWKNSLFSKSSPFQNATWEEGQPLYPPPPNPLFLAKVCWGWGGASTGDDKETRNSIPPASPPPFGEAVSLKPPPSRERGTSHPGLGPRSAPPLPP